MVVSYKASSQSRGVEVRSGMAPGIFNWSLNPLALSCRVMLGLRRPPISTLKLLLREPAPSPPSPNRASNPPRNRNPSGSRSRSSENRMGPPASPDPALRGGAVDPASESSPVRTPVRPMRGHRSGNPTTCTLGSTTRSSNQAWTRASTSWATFGTSWSRLRDPMSERTERSNR